LKDEFSRFGTILSIKLMRDDKGNSRGFGFVSFKTLDEANRAINEMRGKLIEGKNIYVAHRKETRGRDNQNSRQKGGNRWNQNQNQSQNLNQNTKQPRRNNHNNNNTNSNNNANSNKQQGNNPQGQNAANKSNNTQSARSNSSSSSSSSFTPQEAKTQQQSTTNPPQQPTSTSGNLVEEFLSQFSPEHQLPSVAERLYPLILVQSQNAELAGKITGMLMDRYSNPQDLAAFLFDDKSLKEKIDEAAQILNQAQPTQQ